MGFGSGWIRVLWGAFFGVGSGRVGSGQDVHTEVFKEH